MAEGCVDDDLMMMGYVCMCEYTYGVCQAGIMLL